MKINFFVLYYFLYIFSGPSKKLAKNAAAKAALASLCNISYSPMMHPQKNVPLPIDDKTSSMELPQIHADTIGRLVLEKFMEVIKGQESYSRRKVLAGIVMTEDMNFNEAKVCCQPFLLLINN